MRTLGIRESCSLALVGLATACGTAPGVLLDAQLTEQPSIDDRSALDASDAAIEDHAAAPPDTSLDAPPDALADASADRADASGAADASGDASDPLPLHAPRTLSSGNASCAIVTGGAVRCWGNNLSGDLGDGTFQARTEPVTVLGLTDAVELARGPVNCARLASGAVRCWGASFLLGNGGGMGSNIPVEVSGVTDAVELSGSDSGICLRRRSGVVACWGSWTAEFFGASEQNRPVAVAGFPSDVVSVVAGQTRVCAITAARGVVCAGNPGNGDGTMSSSVLPVVVSGLTEVVEVAPGLFNSCARRSNGEVWCWSAFGPVGDGTTEVRPAPVSVGLTRTRGLTVGLDYACAITEAGGVACWGASYGARPTPLAGLTEVVEVRGGQGGPLLARRRDGTVWTSMTGGPVAGL